MKQKLAIIGAGLSGLTLAYLLKDQHDVTVFEKSRGSGGRMATRYTDDYEFDHGAQYFTVRSEAFKAFLTPFIDQKNVQKWAARQVTITDGLTKPYKQTQDIYVGSPRMNSLCKALSQDLNIIYKTRIDDLNHNDNKWRLTSDNQTLSPDFDAVITTAPAPQSSDLLKPHITLPDAEMTGCLTLMIGLHRALDTNWDFAKIENGPLANIILNHTKPDRTNAPCLVVHSRNDWADTHMDDDRNAVKDILLSHTKDILGLSDDDIAYQTIHGWRFANVLTPLGRPYIFDGDKKIGACGDWCIGGRVEAAFESAFALAADLRDRL